MKDDKIEIVISDSEELPTGTGRKIKILELPVFDYEDKKRIERVLEKVDRLSETITKGIDTSSIDEINDKISRLVRIVAERDASYAGTLEEIRDSASRLTKIIPDLRDTTSMEEVRDAVNNLISMISESRDTASLEEVRNAVSKLLKIMADAPDTQILTGIKDNLGIIASSLQTNDERIVNFLGRTVENLEGTAHMLGDITASTTLINERLNTFETRTDEKLYVLDSTINYLKGVLIDATAKISAASEDNDKKISVLVENINEKFDAHMAILNSRLENMSLQVIEPLNDMSLRIEGMKANGQKIDKMAESLKSIEKKVDSFDKVTGEMDTKLEDLKSVSEKYSVMVDNISTFNDTVKNNAESAGKKMDSAVKSFSKKMKDAEKKTSKIQTSIKKTLDEVKNKDTEIKGLLGDVRRVNLYLSRLDDAEFLLRIIDAKKKMSKRLRVSVADRKRISKSLLDIENDILDLSIVALVRKKKMNLIMIKKTLGISETKVRQRIKKLTADGKIKKERLGRYFVYSVV